MSSLEVFRQIRPNIGAEAVAGPAEVFWGLIAHSHVIRGSVGADK